MTVRRIVRVIAAAAIVAANLLVAAPAANGAISATFGPITHEARFARSLTFEQPVSLAAPTAVRRVEIVLQLVGESGARVRDVQVGGTLGTGILRFAYDLTEDHIYPNTRVQARFRIIDTDGEVTLGPVDDFRYTDERFTWRTLSGGIVRVHWYEGPTAFGRRALSIGEAAVAKSQALLGLTETEPVDFWIYADVDDFYDALGPGTRENVGGVAVSNIRTLFALIEPSEIDDAWVGSVIPHELSHLVFNSAVENPYHDPPRWLDEGLAVYDSDGYTADRRARVTRAVRDGTLIPLPGIAGFFPTTFEKFALGYAESVSAVDFLVRTFGRDALNELISSYREGRTDDEAFTAAIGVDVEGFDALWRLDLGAKDPVLHGPQPAPEGPLPSGWTRTPDAPATTPTPVLTPAPTRAPTPTPAPTSAGSPPPISPLLTPTPSASAGAPLTPPSPTPRSSGQGTTGGQTPAPSSTRVAVASGAPATPGPAEPAVSTGLGTTTLALLLGLLAVVLAVVGVGLIVSNWRGPTAR